MIWKKKTKKTPHASSDISRIGKALDKTDTVKIKGGKTSKIRIWNGCGGIIPQ